MVDCMQGMSHMESVLSDEEMNGEETNHILDEIESCLALAQEITNWKMNNLVSLHQKLMQYSSPIKKPQNDKPVVAKVKTKVKKVTSSNVKEKIRRSERQSPALTKPANKDEVRLSTPRQRRKGNKEGDCYSNEFSSSKKRPSGRPSKSSRKKQASTTPLNLTNEPTYCLCDQVSFGEMIGCDNEKCAIEWFHFECVQLKVKPKGKWYCPACRGDRTNVCRSNINSK
ncbi:hypothetical protein AB6A40_011125 [Gnathostoma spinigerum]|uniref:PHD-type domain-containing protein n=1 Tax=Gnathostoma spinigerum TaxID=75299 RepID=A0ABD6F2F4_9BILA